MPRKQRVLLAALVGVLLAAFALRLEQLGVQSLWYDETVSAVLAARPLPQLVAHTARDIHPPLYYALLRYWSRLMGPSEFALAFFSLWWGVLLVASSATLARWLGGDKVGLLTAALVTLSPFNIWYSQEVRMYTLGATLGIWSLMALWQLLRGTRMKKRWMTLWLFSAVMGLYTLYYFAFLLLWEALFVGWRLWRNEAEPQRWRRWLLLGGSALLLWLPWLPIAFRQATNPPVPPWRDPLPLGTMVLESVAALAFGQSLAFRAIGEVLLLVVFIFVVGLLLGWRQKRTTRAFAFLLGALLLPLAILVLSAFTAAPLYHVRYLFTYSPAFYILLAIAFTAIARWAYQWARLPGAAAAATLLLAPLLVLSAESIQRFWHDTHFAADDLRGGVQQIEERWRTGDVVLVNAGYTYTAFDYYLDDPVAWQERLLAWDEDTPLSEEGLTLLQGGTVGADETLGWGLPESDFYAMTAAETSAQLESIAERANRLWHFRLYDTVTDPDEHIRNWLEAHAVLFYDELLTGESNGRVQGWYLPPPPNAEPAFSRQSHFLGPTGEPWVTLHGVDPPRGPQVGGSWVDLTLWLEGHAAMEPDLRLSLGLFDSAPIPRQWAPVLDERPLGPLRSLTEVDGVVRWPVRLRLPQGVPPGKYEAHLKFYRPADGMSLPPQGENVVPPDRVRVAVVEVGPTPPIARAPVVGTPLDARFGPLQLLGHAIPPGPWEQGASIPVELVWRATAETENDLRIFLTSDALDEDEGGVARPDVYPTSRWHAGEVVRDVHHLTLAPNAAPGEYPLYLRVSREAETLLWTQGLFRSGEVLQIGTLVITDRTRIFEPPEVDTPLDVVFGDSIHLIGATLPRDQYQPGQEVPLTLNWHALGRPPGRYKIFTHLIDPSGNLRAQRDSEPGVGRLPTNGWARGEYVTTAYTIPLPPDTPPGTYELRVGLYAPATGERVPLFGPNVNGSERYVVLGSVAIGE